MRLLIDTNRYSDFDSGNPEIVARYESASQIWLSLIVIGELRAGFAGGNQCEENEIALKEFLAKYGAAVLVPNGETTLVYAEIFVALKRQGTPIPTNDIWIASQALQYDLTLDTRDEHFRHVPGLKLVDSEA